MSPWDDPTEAPNPHGGWSHQSLTLQDAVISHIDQGYLVHPSGVFDATGAYRHEAVHWRGRPLMRPFPAPEPSLTLRGTWVWGGVLMAHFGHFLMESLGRLWGVTAEAEGIVFLAESGFRPGAEVKAWQRRILALLGLDLPIHIVTEATRVETLIVPGQGFGIGPLIGGTAPFRDFVQSRFAREIPADGPERLYLSRSKLSLRLGGIVREAQLEKELARRGYVIFHPQDHGIDVQIARYKAARQIIGLDGSAMHLLALVARPEQEVAVIKRRPGAAAAGVIDHLASFMGHPPLGIEAFTRHWVRSDRSGPDNFSFGELDFTAVGRQLALAGFHEGEALGALREERALEFIAKVEAEMARKGLTFHPFSPEGEALPRPEMPVLKERPRKARRKA